MKHLTAERLEELATGGQDPHLQACAECRQQLKAAVGRRKLLKGMKDLTLTEAAFRRVEAKVMGELEKPTTPWGLVRGVLRANWVLAAAAAALVLLVAVPRLLENRAVPTPVAVKEKQPPHTPKLSQRALMAVLVEGEVSRSGVRMVAGDELLKGDLLDARKGRLVLAELGGDSRFELTGSARFGGEALFSLEDGVLAVDSPSEVLVEAVGAWVLGTDSAFVVSRVAADVVVEVLRGNVRVGSDSMLSDSVTVSAPARLKLPLPVKPPFQTSGDPAPYPFAAIPAKPWARLEVGDLSAGSSFEIDGQSMGGTPASLLLTEGRHRVKANLRGQPSREAWVQVVSGTDTRFKLPPAVEKEEPPPSDDAIAELQRAIKDQRPKLAACYEKWLKANPAATGQVELTLVISKSGKVTAARVEASTIPRDSVDCLVRTGKTLRLPALGSEQEIQVPLVLTPSGSR